MPQLSILLVFFELYRLFTALPGIVNFIVVKSQFLLYFHQNSRETAPILKIINLLWRKTPGLAKHFEILFHCVTEYLTLSFRYFPMSAISLLVVSFVILILTIITVLPMCKGKTNKHLSWDRRPQKANYRNESRHRKAETGWHHRAQTLVLCGFAWVSYSV